jgi:Ala-tRNA(Pro) deacylase
MPIANRWLDYLDAMRIRYSHSVHAPAMTARGTAEAERMPAREFSKTVVYFGEAGYGIAVVPADQFVDLARIAELFEMPSVRLADEAELSALFPDCELGAMPPFGDAIRLPVIVDARLAGDFIAFTIGTHRDVVRMSFADFRRLADPTIARIAVGHEVLAF